MQPTRQLLPVPQIPYSEQQGAEDGQSEVGEHIVGFDVMLTVEFRMGAEVDELLTPELLLDGEVKLVVSGYQRPMQVVSHSVEYY